MGDRKSNLAGQASGPHFLEVFTHWEHQDVVLPAPLNKGSLGLGSLHQGTSSNATHLRAPRAPLAPDVS